MTDELARHRFEQSIAGGVAAAVVDRLEAVEIDEQQHRLAVVALQVGERALEFALEAAPIENVE
jgi:NOL1/NOP2/fmu family ribosome biogenesis protein